MTRKNDAGATPEVAEQANSDPWPFLVVDRAVEPAVSLLSTRLGVTPQHARGGLVGFWGNCADPRDLERLFAAGKREVVFSKAEVTRRFALAMAVDVSKVDAEDLAVLRLLERLPDTDTFRVRGMSRYFEPLERRLQFRAAASAGGKASAKARKAKFGTAQPRSANGSASASSHASGVASETLRRKARRARSDLRSDAEAPPNTEDRGQRSLEEAVASPPEGKPRAAADGCDTKSVGPQNRPPEAEATKPSPKPSRQQVFHAWAQAEAKQRNQARTDEAVGRDVLNFLLTSPLDKVGREGLELAWHAFLDDGYAEGQGWPLKLFASQWQKHHNAAVAGLKTQPKALTAEERRELYA